MTYVLTLQLDAASQAHFNRLRAEHFPPERNLIDAHVTLFHTLPEDVAIVDRICAEAAMLAPFTVAVTGLRSLGRGVAYMLESSSLLAAHRRLSEVFAPHLTAQDRQKFQPHIVVQNKVTAEVARDLLRDLRAGFAPRAAQATGLILWHYRGGPWELARAFDFS